MAGFVVTFVFLVVRIRNSCTCSLSLTEKVIARSQAVLVLQRCLCRPVKRFKCTEIGVVDNYSCDVVVDFKLFTPPVIRTMACSGVSPVNGGEYLSVVCGGGGGGGSK